MSIELRGIGKAFGATVACDDVDLRVAPGELVALLGPSGSGKTTLLRILAGLERPDRGRVLLHGEDATELGVRERQVGFVFQSYALFEHLSVFENVAFGLRVMAGARRPAAELRRRVDAKLALVQLDGLAGRHPHQLSGGQRQRVALARALVLEPRLLLLDEPFGALDATVRKELRRWLRRLHDEVHVTSVFVTHDQEEAMEVADRVVVMNRGRIEQVGAPDEVYDRPATPFVMQFLGDVNRLAADGTPATGDAAGASYVRPHEIELLGAAADGAWPAILCEALTAGAQARLAFRRGDGDDGSDERIRVELPRADYQALDARLALAPGSRVWLRPRRVSRFPATGA